MSSVLGTTMIVAITVASLALLVVSFTLKDQRKSLRILGLKWLQAMRIMLMHVQKHRGLVSAWQAGSIDGGEELDNLRNRISIDISGITDLGDWIHENPNWQGITGHWARLSTGCLTLSADQSFNQHCRLISSLLALMVETAERHQLKNSSRFGELGFVWHELLNIAELIGQSRALGMQVLGLKNHNRLLAQHKEQIKQGLEELEHMVYQPACQRTFSGREIEEISGFIEFVRVHLVQNIGLISANEYFNKASATIEIVYQRFDEEMQKLYRLV